jgi:hypothetical protein
MPNLPWPHRTIFQITILGRCEGQSIVNTLHFEATAVQEALYLDDALAQADAGALVDDWLANMMTPWRAVHGNSYTVAQVNCQVLERPGTFRHKLTTVERPLSSANAGTINEALGRNLTASVVTRWRTPVAGKSHRGRMYIGPIPADLVSSGTMSGSTFTTYKAFGDAQVARYVGTASPASKWQQTIYSRPYNEGEYQYATRNGGPLHVVTPPDYAGNSTNVTTAVTDNIFRVQRRREIGVGG